MEQLLDTRAARDKAQLGAALSSVLCVGLRLEAPNPTYTIVQMALGSTAKWKGQWWKDGRDDLKKQQD